MKATKLLSIVSSLAVVVMLLAGCGTEAATPTPGTQPAATTGTSGQTGGQVSGETYIPIISKGFQHQFWQAVKAGAEKAAKEMNVKITFEGPESETQVDKQIEML